MFENSLTASPTHLPLHRVLSIKKIIRDLPTTPGVYLFRDQDKKVLYVGKALNLQNRVSSYFQNKQALPTKTQALIQKVAGVDHINVENELEALLLEAELIKRYRPSYNISLKDDKFFKYIKISHQNLPIPHKKEKRVYKIGSVRKKLEDKSTYLGPYPETTSIYIILKTLRRIFPFRDCSGLKYKRYQNAKRPCLYGQIGLCPAPCQNQKGIKRNNDNIKNIHKYLKGNKSKLFSSIKVQMNKAAKQMEYEKAAILRNQLQSYEYLTQNKRSVRDYVSFPDLLIQTRADALEELMSILQKCGLKFKRTKIENFRIEIYDISNIQGKSAVGSMVVLTGGNPDRSEYKRFRIKTKITPDDYTMMAEVLKRRFAKHKTQIKKWQHPNIIVVDGGKGQLSVALDILQKKDISIPAIALAKRHEEIIIKIKDKFQTVIIPRNSQASKLIQLGRNEAHRFAISYHRRLHRKRLYNT